MTDLHKKLKSLFNWPIPFWLSPLGILVIFSIWKGFDWKLDSTTWPIWFWALDKFITIISIIAAALIAQNIFNKNAKSRENRERRLKVIEKLIETTTSLNATWNQMKFKKSSEDLSNEIITLTSHIIKIRSLGDTYEFKILEDLNDFQANLDKLWIYFIEGEGKEIIDTDPDKVFNYYLSKEDLYFQGSKINSIINTLKKSHKEIENSF